MASRRRRREGPRQAVRWIGDAFVLEGDMRAGVPAVWRGPPRREAKCAVVRVSEVSRDWEFGVDELPLHAAAATLVGPGIIPRFATYARGDDVVIIEDDVADLTLRDLIDGLQKAGAGEVPLGLALYVARELLRACETAGEVRVQLAPKHVAVTWDGRVLLRPPVRRVDVEDLEGDDEPLDGAPYFTPPDERALEQLLVVGTLVYELFTGAHPFAPRAGGGGDDDDDDDDADIDGLVTEMRRRMDAGDYERFDEPAPLALLVEQLIGRGFVSFSEAALAAGRALEAEPFDARALSGMLRGLFPRKLELCLEEREDRLQVMPGPKVEPEAWKLLDADAAEGETDGYQVVDLDGMKPTWNGRGEVLEAYEPSVDPVDPFDDE